MWTKTDDGDWVNLDLAVKVRIGAPPVTRTEPREEGEPDHATVWLLDGREVVVAGRDFARLRAALEGKPPKDALVDAYRKG